jgi:hypothetical protein
VPPTCATEENTMRCLSLMVLALILPREGFADEPSKFYLIDGQVVEKRLGDLERRVADLEKRAAGTEPKADPTLPGTPSQSVLGWDWKKVCTEAGCKLVKVPAAAPAACPSGCGPYGRADLGGRNCTSPSCPANGGTVIRMASSYYQGPAPARSYVSPTGHFVTGRGHTHTCPYDGTTWDHGGWPSHNCPTCGTQVTHQDGGGLYSGRRVQGPIRRFFGRWR